MNLSYTKFRSLTIVIALICLFSVSFIMMVVQYAAQQELQGQIRENEEINLTLATALQVYVRQSIEDVNSLLLLIKAEYEQDLSLDPEFLKTLTALDKKYINHLAVADATGRIVYTTANVGLNKNISNRIHFLVHQQSDQAGLYIAEPRLANSTGQQTIYLTRRLNNKDGSFAGVAIIGIDPQHFSEFFSHMRLDSSYTVNVALRSGKVLARVSPFGMSGIGSNISGHVAFPMIEKGQMSGNFESEGIVDGIPRLGAYRVLEDYPVVVIVNTLKDAIYEPIYARQHIYYAVAAAFCLMLVLAMYLLWRKFREQYLSQQALRKTENDYLNLMNKMSDAYFRLNKQGRIEYINPAALHLLGWQAPENLLGTNLLHWACSERECSELLDQASGGELISDALIVLKHAKGSKIPFSASIHQYFDQMGQPQGLEIIARDITERQKTEEKLKYLSFHDCLTKLYNRAYFNQELQRIQINGVKAVGIIVADIDGLKVTNDTFGHEAGDQLIKEAALVLQEACSQAVIARIGGDEFALVWEHTTQAALIQAVERIRATAMSRNRENLPGVMPLYLSVGWAYAAQPPETALELFTKADNYMYREKLNQASSRRSNIVQTLKEMLAVRDYITSGHASRMEEFMVAIAEKLGFDSQRINDLRLFAEFHDIGKVGIPDRILNKPGPLDSQEQQEMQLHAEIGHRIARASQELAPIAEWVLKHHEWWNGAGYPLGLAHEQIPLECRILSIVDAYDAMTHDRPYRKALSKEQALDELRRFSGKQFDPALVEQLIAIVDNKNEVSA